MPAAQWSTIHSCAAATGGHRHQRQPVREVAVQQLLQRAATFAMRAGPQVYATAASRSNTTKQAGSQPASQIGARMEPLLECVEVEVAVVPHDDLPVDDRVGGEPGDRVDYLREVPAQRPLLARLQRHPTPAAEGDAAETVELRLKRPATRPVQRKRSAVTAIIGRSGNSMPANRGCSAIARP
jgi:hypothetical protein